MNNGKICVSVCAETANEFIEKIERAAKIADFVELRFDCLASGGSLKLYGELIKMKENFNGDFLGTFRPMEQGGKRELSLYERIDNWRYAGVGKPSTDWVDLEFDLDLNFLGDLPHKKIIRSFHNFSVTSNNLEKVYVSLLKGSDVVKIAVQADDAIDGLALMKLLERAKAEKREFIPIAMGESGVWTRILGLARGAFMTFASLDDESATAPGQLTAQEMTDVYRVKELDEDTQIYGLVAGSVAHSVSPQMHNAAFKFHKLNAVYVPFAVKNLEEFVRRMVSPKTREIDWNFRGFSVTLPHKVEIMKHLDFVDETAQKIGAVNTVKIDDNRLLGFNTDAAGFVEPLKNAYGELRNTRVAVFGAGGAARACIYALQREGAEVTVFARNLEKAKGLTEDFDVETKELQIQNPNSKFQNYDVVVNATPLGMKKGGLGDETPAVAEQLEGVRLVYDLVYNPFQTKFMKEAEKVFVPTIGGLAMLVAQAMAQQEIWTELDAPMKEMSAAALRKLS